MKTSLYWLIAIFVLVGCKKEAPLPFAPMPDLTGEVNLPTPTPTPETIVEPPGNPVPAVQPPVNPDPQPPVNPMPPTGIEELPMPNPNPPMQQQPPAVNPEPPPVMPQPPVQSGRCTYLAKSMGAFPSQTLTITGRTIGDAAVDSMGRLVVVGSGPTGTTPNARLFSSSYVARFLPNGMADGSFGTNGVREFDIPNLLERVQKVTLQVDGKILVAGTFPKKSIACNTCIREAIFAARLNEDGSLDSTFKNEISITAPGILEVGTPDLVFTFGNFGIGWIPPTMEITALLADKNGFIYVTGSLFDVVNRWNGEIIALNSDGSMKSQGFASAQVAGGYGFGEPTVSIVDAEIDDLCRLTTVGRSPKGGYVAKYKALSTDSESVDIDRAFQATATDPGTHTFDNFIPSGVEVAGTKMWVLGVNSAQAGSIAHFESDMMQGSFGLTGVAPSRALSRASDGSLFALMRPNNNESAVHKLLSSGALAITFGDAGILKVATFDYFRMLVAPSGQPMLIGNNQVEIRSATEGVDTAVLGAIPDQTVTAGNLLQVDLSFAGFDTSTLQFSAAPENIGVLNALDREFNFFVTSTDTASNYYLNDKGFNEKYIIGDSAIGRFWYVILPNGDLYRMVGSTVKHTLIARLSPSVWNNPALLYNPATPNPVPVAATILGSSNRLNIQPVAGFYGTFSVTVTATDGSQTKTRTFKVSVRP